MKDMKRWSVRAAVVIPILLLAAVCGCQFKPDPYCPGGQVVVSKCAVCRMVWTGAGYACAGPEEYAAATQAASQPSTQPSR